LQGLFLTIRCSDGESVRVRTHWWLGGSQRYLIAIQKVLISLLGFGKFKRKGKKDSESSKHEPNVTENGEVPKREKSETNETEQKSTEDNKGKINLDINFSSSDNKDKKSEESFIPRPPSNDKNYLPIAIFFIAGLGYIYYIRKNGGFHRYISYKVEGSLFRISIRWSKTIK
jgi:hypothetical protein